MPAQTREMTTATEMQALLRLISALPNKSLLKLADYVEELIEEIEEAEDIAYIEAHKDDGPSVPFEEVIKDFEAKHGPLYQD